MLERKNNSLKEYYIKLQSLYNNAVNMITAINQSLTTTASEITLNIEDIYGDNQTSVRIPSFIYLENKLEQLSSNFNNLFNIPESGEAWFSNENNMYKLQLLKSNAAPVTPEFNISNIFSYTKQNNLFKDLVNPKTFIKLNITNLPSNISSVYVKKVVFNSVSLYDELISKNVTSYNDFKAAVYNLRKGIDYIEYDSEIKLPIKQDEYNAFFDIIDIPKLESGNPYTFNTVNGNAYSKLRYNIRLNTINYSKIEDDTCVFELKVGDQITLINSNTIYNIIDIDTTSNMVIIEEAVGHSSLQTVVQNSEMVFTLYNKNFDKYKYVEIPLEENPYICIFVSTIYNNIRSLYSSPLYINLNNIVMKDENNNVIYNNDSTPMTYIEYYNKYCNNIGDLMLGFMESTYPQLTNYNSSELKNLQENTLIQQHVTNSITNNNLKVLKINNHLIDDEISKNILSLHNEKSQLKNNLLNIQSNIDQVYNQLVTTDFSKESSLKQLSLKSKLNGYYNERATLQTQLNVVVDNISVLKNGSKNLSNPKFRVRGITNTDELNKFLKENYTSKCEVIGLEVQYKYRSPNTDTTSVSVIDSAIFSDWNVLHNIEKDRKLSFNQDGTYYITFENYDRNNNVIKWNQIDIPITHGEDVILKIRYKYCIGQPFINLYTPWSNEFTVTFPEELASSNEISSIISNNNDDVIGAKFNATLINEGYQEHIANKIIDNSQIYYHMPENIYSGFNTPENKLLSLKDKLQEISKDLYKYTTLIEGESKNKFEVYINYDDKYIPIYNNTVNNIVISDITSSDTYIKKDINIIIKNTGSSEIKLYSLFPGDPDVKLIEATKNSYNKDMVNYERVPLLWGTLETGNVDKMKYLQKMSQWIYFRQTNPFVNNESFYNTDNVMNGIKANKYIGENNYQLLYGPDNNFDNPIKLLDKLSDTIKKTRVEKDDVKDYLSNIINNFKDEINTGSNKLTDDVINKNGYLLCYENIILKNQDNNSPAYLDNKFVSLPELFNKDNKYIINDTTYITNYKDLYGGFLIPILPAEQYLICDKNDNHQYKIIDTNNAISIPLIFEYYLQQNKELSSIEKTIAFDIKPSLIKDPLSYVIKITGQYNNTVSNDRNN